MLGGAPACRGVSAQGQKLVPSEHAAASLGFVPAASGVGP